MRRSASPVAGAVLALACAAPPPRAIVAGPSAAEPAAATKAPAIVCERPSCEGERLASTGVAMRPLVTDEWIYWTELEALMRMPNSGGQATQLVTARLYSAVLFGHSGSVYFTERDSSAAGAVLRAWPDPDPNSAFAKLTIRPVKAVAHGDEIFWTTDDGTVEVVSLRTGVERTIASGQDRPWAIAVDDTAVYWTNQGAGPDTEASFHAPRRGAALMRASLASGAVESWTGCVGFCLLVASASDEVLFHDEAASEIVRVDKSSGRRSRIRSQRGVSALLADGDTAYWADSNGRILRVGAHETTPVLVATGHAIRDLAVDDAYVYWLDADRENGKGTLRRIRK